MRWLSQLLNLRSRLSCAERALRVHVPHAHISAVSPMELVSCFWLSTHSALVSWRAGCSLQQQHVSLGMHQQREQ